MKRKIWVSHLIAGALAFLLSAGAVGCLVTGFGLRVESFSKLMIQCALFSAGCALCFRFRGGNVLILALMAVALGFLWRTGEWYGQLQSLLLNITTRYHKAYGWGVLFPDAPGGASGLVDDPLVIAGWIIALSTAWTVSHRKNALFALPPVLALVIPCFVVTDTVPDELYLYLLMLGAALLLLTGDARRRGVSQGNRLMGLAALPVAAALAVLFLVIPQKGYVNRSEDLQGHLVSLFQRAQSLAQDVSSELSITGADSSGLERLDLSAVGPRTQWGYSVMKVTSPVDGTLYLRGRDYNTYGGSGWVASRHRTEVFTQGGDPVGTLTIRTYGAKDVLYTPYYPEGEVTLTGGAAQNSDRLREYTFGLASSPAANSGTVDLEYEALLSSAAASPDTMYMQLPADTMRWANALARQITMDCTGQTQQAEAIGSYVRNSAVYDLDTARMPDEETDFARWFLEESDTGYCVHFATAAVVLLRGVGIPARYVEGYMISCRAGEETLVTEKAAHAWAEYYDSGSGVWRVLEATPAAAEETETTEPAPLPTEELALPTESERETAAPVQEDLRESTPDPVQSKDNAAAQEPQKTEFRLPGWAKWILGIGAVLLALWLQSDLRIGYQRRLWRRGTPNVQALARYRQCCRLAKRLEMELPEELEALAQKARFSQHTLEREELLRFDAFRREALAKVRTAGWLRRMVLRLVFAVG